MKINYKLAFFGLLLIILIIGGYFAFDYYQSKTYNTGYSDAYNQISSVLISASQKCELIPITYQNKTYQLINVECLNEN